MNSTRYFMRGLLMLALLLSGGCSTWFGSSFERPEVQLVDAEIIQARLHQQEFKLKLRIDNPNNTSLPLRGISYDVQLNDIPLGNGHSTRLIKVPANGHTYVELPVYTNIWRHIRSLVRILEKPDQPISYALQVQVKTGLLFSKKVNVSRRGSLIPGKLLED